MKKFKIQGPFSQDDQQYLFWSNQDGWVDFHSATTFNYEEHINLPMETQFIAILDKDGTVDSLVNSEYYLAYHFNK